MSRNGRNENSLRLFGVEADIFDPFHIAEGQKSLAQDVPMTEGREFSLEELIELQKETEHIRQARHIGRNAAHRTVKLKT